MYRDQHRSFYSTDVTVKGLISLCNELHSDIKLSSSDFHSLFNDILRVDYVQCVCAVIHEKLSRDIDIFMNGIHDELIHEEGMILHSCKIYFVLQAA